MALDRQTVLNRLHYATDVFARAEGVLAAYVFGSVLDSERDAVRDVDFAVLARAPLGLDALGGLLLELEKALGTDRIDVVDLRTARRELAFEALSNGRLLVERDPGANTRLRERVLHDHLAMRHHTRLYLTLLRQEFHRSYARASR